VVFVEDEPATRLVRGHIDLLRRRVKRR